LHGDEFSVLLSFLFGKVRVDQSLVFFNCCLSLHLFLLAIMLQKTEGSEIFQEKLEDTKTRKSKDRQHNGQKKKDKRTNNDL
jgi:hypothetical protein